MGAVSTFGGTALSTMASGTKTKLAARESISGRTAASTKACGKKIICTVEAHTRGKMVAATKANTSTIASTVSASTPGSTVVNTKASGIMVNNMEKVFIDKSMGSIVAGNGKTEKGFAGWTTSKCDQIHNEYRRLIKFIKAAHVSVSAPHLILKIGRAHV